MNIANVCWIFLNTCNVWEQKMRFSIVIPVYNVENYIRDALDSVLNQTFTNYEIIIVNDGSTDNSLSICASYQKKHPNITIINQENGGLSEARNTGLNAARGEFIYFFDSDDYMHPQLLEIVEQHIQSNPSLDLIQFQYESFKGDTIKESSLNFSTIKKNKVMTSQQLLTDLCQGDTIVFTAWSYVIRTSIVQQNKLEFIPKIVNEDVPFLYASFRFIKNYICLPDVLYYYRLRENSITKAFNRDARAYSVSVIINYFYDILYHYHKDDIYLEFMQHNLQHELDGYLLEAFSVREAMFVYRRYGGKQNLSLPKVLWKRSKFLITFHTKNIVKRILHLFHLY